MTLRPTNTPTPGTYGVARLAFTRTLDDTIVIRRSPGEKLDLLKLSPTLADIFPGGVCAVDEFVIQEARFSDANVFVEVRIDDRTYGPFGGPWMTSPRDRGSIQTPGPRAKYGQHVTMTAFVRGLNIPSEMEVHLRCMVREKQHDAGVVVADIGPELVQAPRTVTPTPTKELDDDF